MSDAITAGTLSESDARILSAKYVREKAGLPCAGGQIIPDTDHDYLSERAEISLSDCVKRAEIGLSPSEQRGRYLAAEAAHAETADIETVRKPLIERETWIAVGCCGLAGIALVLVCFDAPLFIGQLIGWLR
jgi:hypothetical protein